MSRKRSRRTDVEMLYEAHKNKLVIPVQCSMGNGLDWTSSLEGCSSIPPLLLRWSHVLLFL